MDESFDGLCGITEARMREIMMLATGSRDIDELLINAKKIGLTEYYTVTSHYKCGFYFGRSGGWNKIEFDEIFNGIGGGLFNVTFIEQLNYDTLKEKSFSNVWGNDLHGLFAEETGIA